MLIPFLGIFVGMTLWSQWFSIPGFTVPEQSFMRRLSGTFQLTMESWTFCDLVDFAVSQGSPFGDRAIVIPADSHGHANLTEGPPFESPFMVPIPVSPWSSDRVTSSDPDEFVPVFTLGSGPGQFSDGTLLLFGLWCFFLGFWASIVYPRRYVAAGIEAMIGWILNFLDDQPQIARVHAVAEENPFSFYEEMDALIAGQTKRDDEGLDWNFATDIRPNDVSHVSMPPRFEGTWFPQTADDLMGGQAMDSELACNRTEPANTTDDACANLVSRPPWNSSDIYASDHDDPLAPVEILNGNGAETAGCDSTPANKRKKNRPSQAARLRQGKRARRESEKELQQDAFGSTVPASSALDASLATSQVSTPLSALAPVFVPGRTAEQELQSGPLSPTPLSVEMDIDLPADCGTTSPDDNASSQRSSRRHRRRKRHA
ncbi:hypothetical protein N7457_009222 [Penicillium paradoxum]|uniref:uncharacterized protein n=1 Tax=Penicillium paradoxum TaxID=176176 RepID=UPI002546A842|nr:uncharacterized protein N7457_009222 [Penicillium paradoxum]KAJ5774326.1 hypothetical protein N7457_009222 [Penicillium paradoxum]